MAAGMEARGARGRFGRQPNGGLSQQRREGMLLAESSGIGSGSHEGRKVQASLLKE